MTIEETEHEENSVSPEHECPVTTSFMDHKVQSEPWEFISEPVSYTHLRAHETLR